MVRDFSTEAKHVLLRLLRESREAAGVSQGEMADALALRQSDVSKIERGVRGLDVLELRRWALAVGVPLEAFIVVLEDQWSKLEHLDQYARGAKAS